MAYSDEKSPPRRGRTSLATLGVVAAFALGSALLASLYLRVFPPPMREITPPLPALENVAPLRDAFSRAALTASRDEILACGSRFLGTEGSDKAMALARRVFEENGLEIIEHSVRTPIPVTERREISLLEPAGATAPQEIPLPAVQIFPFLPNHLQPVATGPGGLDGRLERMTPEFVKHCRDFTGIIGVIDARDDMPDPDLGFNWRAYARLGVKAVIVSHPDGLERISWDRVGQRWSGITGSVSVNYVRLAASKEIFSHLGKTVRLRVVARYKEVPNTTLYGILRAPGGAAAALVLPAAYDALSLLPDHAPGTLQALQPALQLQAVRGLAACRESLRRDVIFIANNSSVMAEDALNHLARILQANPKRSADNPLLTALNLPTPARTNRRQQAIITGQAKNREEQRRVEAAAAPFGDPAFLGDPGRTEALIAGLAPDSRAFLREQIAFVLYEIIRELAEPMLQRQLDFLRTGGTDLAGPAFSAYLEAKQAHDLAVAAGGRSPADILRDYAGFAAQQRFKARVEARFAQLIDFHRRTATTLAQELRVAALFDSYADFAFFNTRLVPGGGGSEEEAVSLAGSARDARRILAIYDTLTKAARRLGGDGAKVQISRPPKEIGNYQSELPPVSLELNDVTDRLGYASYTLFSRLRQSSFQRFADPFPEDPAPDLGSVARSAQLFGEAALLIAAGAGSLDPSGVQEWIYRSYGGRVLLANVGRSVVPNHPLVGATVSNPCLEGTESHSRPGFYVHPIAMTDPYGRFNRATNSNDFAVFERAISTGEYSPIAALAGEDGLIRYIKDEGEDGQRLFKSTGLAWNGGVTGNVTIVTFRAAPVVLFDVTNPQTLRDYSGFRAVSADGLADFRKSLRIRGESVDALFLEPNRRADFLLEAGAPDNDRVRVPRGFMLGIKDPDTASWQRDVDGPGYLLADHPILDTAPLETARSMVAVNGRRLALQERYRMADDKTVAYQARAKEALAGAEDTRASVLDRNLAANRAVAFSMLGHPVIRRSLLEAVAGIVWYLGLLVPFAFFFEKLVCGFADIRKQIAAQAIIFGIAFALLRILHPAFAMVRSSLMILLGFTIMLISLGITLLFSGKFKENLADLRQQQGRVAGAEVNALGVLGSAFLLGLNNMHRRRVRTGLTCATLSLLTFAMICFTSVKSDLHEEETILGRAFYQGMLIKRPSFEPISGPEIGAFGRLFGDRCTISERRYYIGSVDGGTNLPFNASFQATARIGGLTRAAPLDSLLQLQATEPLRGQLGFVGPATWFGPEDERDTVEPCPVIIPDAMAGRLGITPDLVQSGTAAMEINGRKMAVRGIFKAETLDGLLDLDGRDLRPFDMTMTEQPRWLRSAGGGGYVSVPDDAPRIPAERIVITPLRWLFNSVNRGYMITPSIVVGMEGQKYREAKDRIEDYMAQSGEIVHYGLDGVAIRGRRSRETTMAGLVDLLIPLLIAGLTVLNTMKGSVYERRDEILVYNAVGIAPRYVFFMFVAEALVYAVVGAVLGYLISQGTGKILTAAGLTGGLNMTFASLATIQASIAIMVTVIASTWFPARAAMEIAKPADDAGWSLPEPEGDELAFDLPFNFRPRGRIAVLAFFLRYLADHAEGSAGRFFAGRPELALADLDGDEYIPGLRATIWLKPFDLAVSQQMIISTPADPETGQFKARIRLERLSGTRESWTRLNRGFVAQMRRHFLHWRAVTPEEREEMYEEAKARFEAVHLPPTPAGNPFPAKVHNRL